MIGDIYNEAVRLSGSAYDEAGKECVIVNIGVYGALSTFYVSAPRAREMAAELLRLAELTEAAQKANAEQVEEAA